MLQAAVSTNSSLGAEKVRQLLLSLSQEFEALQRHHEAVVQQSHFPQRASTQVDIDAQCDALDLRQMASTQVNGADASDEWPVLTLDVDSGERYAAQPPEGGFALAAAQRSRSLEARGKKVTQASQLDAMESSLAAILDRLSRLEVAPPAKAMGQRDGKAVGFVSGGGQGDSTPKAADRLDNSPSTQERSLRWLDTTPKRSKSLMGTPGSQGSKPESNNTGDSVRKSEQLRRFNKRLGGSSISLGSDYGKGLRRHMRAIYRHPLLETSFAFVILLNALVMCVEFQYNGDRLGKDLEFKGGLKPQHHGWTKPDLVDPIAEVFNVLDWIFGFTFILELVFKTAVLSIHVFTDIWNWIDIVTVGFFIFEKIFGTLLPIGSQWLRLCRLARLCRLIKLVRTIEGFDHLYLMTTAIKGSVRILAWALALLGLIQLTIGLVIGQVLQVTYFEDDTKPLQMQHEIYKYFGTFSRSLLSMFEMTLANWPPICRLLSEEVSEWFMVFCVLHKLTIGFAVVGVINGVFMQETFKVASTDDIIMVRQKAKAAMRHRKNMQDLFDGLDSSGDGKVNRKEFRALASYPVVQAWLASMEIRTDDLDTMFQLMDTDGSDGITFEEMLYGMEQLKGHARSVDLFALMGAQKKQISDLGDGKQDSTELEPTISPSHRVLEMPSFQQETITEQ